MHITIREFPHFGYRHSNYAALISLVLLKISDLLYFLLLILLVLHALNSEKRVNNDE